MRRWVPRLLILEQKHNRMAILIDNLKYFNRNSKEFKRLFITLDETWINHYTPETKQQSKQFTSKGEPAPKKAKVILFANKVMATVFSDARGIILIDYFLKGKTVNEEYYAGLLKKL